MWSPYRKLSPSNSMLGFFGQSSGTARPSKRSLGVFLWKESQRCTAVSIISRYARIWTMKPSIVPIERQYVVARAANSTRNVPLVSTTHTMQPRTMMEEKRSIRTSSHLAVSCA